MRQKKNNPAPENTSAISREQALNCIPLRNPEAQAQSVAQEEETGYILQLSYPVEITGWFRNTLRTIFSPGSSSVIIKKLQLDELGTEVWQAANGTASVQEIITAFAVQHQVDEHEAEVAVTAFLRELGRRGLVVMRQP